MSIKFILFQLLLVCLTFSWHIGASATPKELTDEEPFWRKNPAIYKKIVEERDIVVSAKVSEIALPTLPLLVKKMGQHLEVLSAGAISAPQPFVLEKVLDFEQFTKIMSQIKESHWDATNKKWQVKMCALNYCADMKLLVENKNINEQDEVNWRVVEGSFMGMQGFLHLRSIEMRKTEISMHAQLDAESLPIPKILLGFGMEVAGRQMAASMREYIEKEFQKK